jgi:hypothetical protein
MVYLVGMVDEALAAWAALTLGSVKTLARRLGVPVPAGLGLKESVFLVEEISSIC